MTADDDLYVQFKPTGSDEVGFIDLLIRMTGVHIKARHVLQREDLRTIMETVFVVISCMSSLDHEWSTHGQPEAGRRAERERAEVLGSILTLGLAGVVLANFLDQSGNFDNYKDLLVTGLAGSIGATIGVMWRITFGRFSPSNAIIAFQQGKKASVTLAILGAVRPFIGTVLGSSSMRSTEPDSCPSNLRTPAPTSSISTRRSPFRRLQ